MADNTFLLKHMDFIKEFFETGVASTSYKKFHDVSDRVAERSGGRIIRDKRVQELIRTRVENAAAALEVTADSIMTRLWNIANSVDTPASTKVAALVNIGKQLGMFQTQLKIDNQGAPLIVKEIIYVNAEVRKDEHNNSIPIPPKGIPGPSI